MQASNYIPDLPEDEWAAVREFALAVFEDVVESLPYEPASIINAVAHHVDWCVNVAGLPLTRDFLFRRDVIGSAVAVMPTRRPSTKGRRRSLMLRVGESLGVIPVPVLLSPLSAATPSTPYNRRDVAELQTWAHHQSTAERSHSARVLLALGLGVGLPTRDLGMVRARDVLEDGAFVHVMGDEPRLVPVRDEWGQELEALSAVADLDAPLFRPRVARTKNFVSEFVTRTIGLDLRPSTQRMRSTWLVEHLSEGMPMQNLLAASGLKSMDALTRYQRFLPAPSIAVPADSP